MAYQEVTDKKIKIDGAVLSNIDFCMERHDKGWDTVMIVDGDEGSGKTTFSFAIGYYWAWKTGVSFSEKNIFFDPDEMFDFASKNTRQVIIWDEAAIAALAEDFRSDVQKKLVKALMMCRKKGHLWIFNIPKFYRLREYIAVDRAFFLIHVYTPDFIKRGFFTFCNKKKKDMIYDAYKNTKKRRYDWYNFPGTFPDYTDQIIDDELYQKKKDEALLKIFTDKPKKTDSKQVKQLKYIKSKLAVIHKHLPIRQKDLAKYLGYSETVLPGWRHLNKDNLENKD